jgi:hypothetical protein
MANAKQPTPARTWGVGDPPPGPETTHVTTVEGSQSAAGGDVFKADRGEWEWRGPGGLIKLRDGGRFPWWALVAKFGQVYDSSAQHEHDA